MSGAEILENLHELGVSVMVIGPDRLRLEPASKIPPELVSNIRKSKAEILAVLGRTKEASMPDAPCRACGSRLFWRSTHGVIVCWRCHPGSEAVVRDILWLERRHAGWTAEVTWTQ
jgi:hypothetical protein